jgi:hypothetical protein
MTNERIGYHFAYELWMLEGTLRRLTAAPAETLRDYDAVKR